MTTPVALPFPNVCFSTSDFSLDAGTAQAAHGAGRLATVSRVREALWTARFDTGPVSRSDRVTWLAWGHGLDGGLVPFLASDTSLGLPRAYAAAGLPGGWDGAASVVNVPSPTQIALSALPASYQALHGDRMSLVQTVGGVERRGYFEIAADAQATIGGALIVTVRPFVSALFSAGAQAQLVRPACAFRIPVGGFRAPAANVPTVSFEAVQVF